MQTVTVRGKLMDKPDRDTVVRFVAAAPADHRGSFSGGGFPFTNEDQAFSGTPNMGVLPVDVDGSFRVDLLQPNSYYKGLGTVLVPPTLYVGYVRSGQMQAVSAVLGPPTPFRTLTYPHARHDVMFYDRGSHDVLNPDRDARTQEQILRESAYPITMLKEPSDFWGLMAPQ
ncbi:MAG: hypothetical protein WDW38_006475 [Sanguina aurantia]